MGTENRSEDKSLRGSAAAIETDVDVPRGSAAEISPDNDENMGEAIMDIEDEAHSLCEKGDPYYDFDVIKDCVEQYKKLESWTNSASNEIHYLVNDDTIDMGRWKVSMPKEAIDMTNRIAMDVAKEALVLAREITEYDLTKVLRFWKGGRNTSRTTYLRKE